MTTPVSVAESTVLVTGGAGFIGSHVAKELVARGATVHVVDDESRGDMARLTDVPGVKKTNADLTDPAVALAVSENVDYCFHLAAVVGSVEHLSSNPALMFQNLLIDYNVLFACSENDVEKAFYTSSACVYPTDYQQNDHRILSEDDAFNSGASPDGDYGWTKTIGEVMARAFDREYDMDVVVGRPFNPYGPHESFDPDDSHVIPAFIRRAVDGEDPFVVWGSGDQVRTFTYVEDLADGMIDALEQLDGGTAVNLSTTESVTIANLAEVVLDIVGHDAEIAYDETKPEGVKVRKPDMSRGFERLDWNPDTSLRDGIAATVDWYESE